jgi:CrcB protein
VALVSALAVGLGGALGAVCRYAVSRSIDRRGFDVFAVNVAGSFLLGVVLGLDAGGPVALAASTGFCGAFTTFSSFAVGTVGLLEEGSARAAIANAAGTLAAAIIALLAGTAAAGAVI